VTYDQVAKASNRRRRDATKILTIANRHVEYATANRQLRARGLPGARRLREEHDHGGGADDGAILVVSAVDGPMPQTREHILLARQVNVPPLSCS